MKENPFDEGQGWGRVPWCQKEMEVTEEMLDCARNNDVSLVIIGRTAGEDQDNNAKAGSYCLTETEEDESECNECDSTHDPNGHGAVVFKSIVIVHLFSFLVLFQYHC